MKLVIDIPDSSVNSILPLIDYLKSFDFIKIRHEEVETYSKLSLAQEQEIEYRTATTPKSDYISLEEIEKRLDFGE